MGISNDMKMGNDGEDKVKLLVENAGFHYVKNIDEETRLLWDLAFGNDDDNDNVYTVEVKNDNYSLKSGNIAIEVENTSQKKPSGLMATESDLWAIVRGDEVWLANTQELRSFVMENKPFKVIENGGDGNALLLLYKIGNILPAIFEQIDGLDEKELKDIINRLLEKGV